MKYLILIIVFPFFLSCKGQSLEFATYLSNFRSVELPITIDRRYWSTHFYQNGMYKEISEPLVKKFVYKDSLDCPTAPLGCRYDYGAKFEVGTSCAVLLSRLKYEGVTPYDFDLSETILLIYSEKGEILSLQSIGKDNDGWISTIQINEYRIEVQQIKIMEFNKPEMNCKIETIVYQIDPNGIINDIRTATIEKGVVIWDEQINDFRLK